MNQREAAALDRYITGNYGEDQFERGRELYAEKANRDKRAAELKAEGFAVKRSSIRNQQVHPMYVCDRNANLSDEDRGFGNTIYKTTFAVLYEVSWE